MDNKLGIIGKVLSYLLMAAGLAVTIVILMNSFVLDESNKLILDSDQRLLKEQILNITVIVAGIALALTILLSVLFPLGNMIMNPKNLVRFLIVLGALGLMYFISYSLAEGNITDYMKELEYLTDEKGSKFVGSMIYLVYIIGGLAIVSTLASSVLNIFKR